MMEFVDDRGRGSIGMAMKQRRKVSNEVAMVHILTIFFYCALTMSIVWALTIAFR